MHRSFARSRFVVALLALALASPLGAQTGRVLVCGDDLLAATSDPLPGGLPSNDCSEAVSFGEGAYRSGAAPGGGSGVPILEAVALVKPLDANSIRFRERLLGGGDLGKLRLHAFTAGGLQYLELEVRAATPQAISTGTAGARPVESLRLVGDRYTWRVWSPAAPPGATPTATFCWDVATQSSC